MLSLCVLFRENGGLMLIVLLISQIIKVFQLQKNGEKINRSIWLLFLLPYLMTAIAYYTVSYKYPTFYTTENVDCSLISIGKMALYYLNQIRVEIFNFDNFLSSIAFIGTFILFVIGLTKKYKEEYVAIIMLCTFVFYTVCPLKQGVRYILPLTPFVFIFIGFSALNLKKLRLKLFILFFLFLIFCNVTVLSKMNLLSKIQDRDINYGVNSTSAKELYSYIRGNTSKDSKIIYWHPRAIYLYTGRQSFQISEEKDKLKNADYQVSIIGNDRPASSYDIEMYDYNKKTYIPETEIYLNPVYRNENFVMYKIEKT